MQQIDAIFEDRVFKPVGPVSLEEKQRVRLSIEPVREGATQALPDCWEQAKEFQEKLFNKYGFLPDSTADIAEDRKRDV